MFVNDVGEVTWEEINDGIAGSNYGWPTVEGPSSNPSFRSPLFAYGHGSSLDHRVCDSRRRLLQPGHLDLPIDVRRPLLLRRSVQRLDSLHQPGQPVDRLRVRHRVLQPR